MCKMTEVFCSEKYMCFKALKRAGKEKIVIENKCTLTTEYENTMPAAAPDFPPQRVVERKIGRATFIVSSRFSDGKQKDLVSTLTRLIQHDSENKAG